MYVVTAPFSDANLLCAHCLASHGLGYGQPTTLHRAVQRDWCGMWLYGGSQEAGRTGSSCDSLLLCGKPIQLEVCSEHFLRQAT